MGELKEIVRDSLEEFVVHFRVMLKKNWLVSKRSYKTIIAQLIAPILFILLLFGLNNIGNSEERDPPTETFQNFPICKADDTSEKKCISLMYVYNGRDTSSFPNSTAFMDMNDADSIMNLISSKYNIPVVGYTSGSDIDSNSIYKFSSRTELDQYIIDHPNTTQSAIVFEPNDTSIDLGSSGPTYTILINGTNPDLESAQFVQTAVDQSILTHFGRKLGIIPTSVTPEYKVATRKWPVIDVAGYDAVASYGGLFFYCAIMFNFTIFLYQIVNEKQLELRKGMRMIGLSDVAYWLSWEVTNLIFIVVYCLIIIFFGYITGLAFFLRTHFLVLFFTFFLFGFAMTQLAVLLGMFITTTKQAINVGMLIFVVGTVAQIIFSVNFIFQILYWPEQASPAYRIILQFYPPFNFSKLINDISTKANAEAVRALDPSDKSLLFRWSDLYEERNMIQFSIPQAADSMWLLVMNILLFSALAWFFYNVLPSEKSGPFYFIFTRDYWARLFPKRNYSTPNVQPDPKDDSDVQEEVKQAVSNTSAELRVLGLHKKFTKLFSCGRGIYAVRGMNLSVGSGQVFALLGHNGAGKTTTLSILTGIIKATKGDAIIFGKSLKHELTEVQRIIGVCPQHNILWDELTAREHLEIFSEIRRVPKAEREAEIVARLKDVLLLEAQNKKSGEYSGGMKRRLMVAVSAIGNPKVIFLDEPTTGLDPMSRREIWSAVQQLKKDRIIILTTHSMEEADFLGDRIGIMARGRLKCIGTSLHLKNKFGLGYRLNITTRPEKQESFKMEFARLVPNAELIAETVGGNLVYGVQTAQLDKLVPFFQNIEGDNALGVKDWGISQTTLEEVFLKVTHESEGVDVTIMK